MENNQICLEKVGEKSVEQRIEYERTLTGSYMKLVAAEKPLYDEKIMLKNRMSGFISVEKSYLNGQAQYWYDISGYQSLAVYCSIKKINIDFVERIILTICDQIDIMERNLLDINCLMLDTETIFVSNTDEGIKYVIYPNDADDIAIQVRSLMEFLLTKLDHSDRESVHIAYEIYEKTLEPDYSILEIKETIINRRKERIKDKIEVEVLPVINIEESIDTQEEKETSEEALEVKTGFVQKLLDIIEQYLGIDLRKLWIKKNDVIIKPDKKQDKDKQDRMKLSKGELDVAINEVAKKQIHPTVCLSDYREHPQGLLLYEGFEGLENITINENQVRIGQAEELEVVIDKPTISRYHALIEKEQEEFYLMDMNSSNGTYVNNAPIGYRERHKLEINDIVRFADVKYRFV